MPSSTGSIAILGSCVSRDAINFIEGLKVSTYLARMSLISLYAKPWAFEATEDELIVEGKGEFENRMLRHDLCKTASEALRSSEPAPLLIDFIDERFDVFVDGETALTRSTPLMLTKYGKALAGPDVYRRHHARTLPLWEKAADRFLADIAGRKVILHRALWASHYRNDDTGEICSFDDKDLESVALHNRLLDHYYDYIEQRHGSVVSIRPEPEFVYSDFAHRWGRDFFHFSPDYYGDIAKKIEHAL
jgi:hypothetical protein